MNTALELPGAIEVFVLAEEGVVLNNPEHRSLGLIHMGETAVTHECYLQHLQGHGLACLASEMQERDISGLRQQFASLGLELDIADSQEPEGSVDVAPKKKPTGRPRTAK
jgi:hypothetical protein